MSRWKAAAIHLLISFLVVGAVVLAITLIWYPPAIWSMAKVAQLILIMAVVDVVIGPLLTLIVFRSDKPSLRFDLSVIALLQVAALAYGLFSVWQSRPVFIVGTGNVGRFNLVFANDIDPEYLAQADSRYAELPWFGPRLVGAELPLDQALRQQLMWEGMSGYDIQFQPRYFVDYAQVADSMRRSVLSHKQDGSSDNSLTETDCVAPYVSKRGVAGMRIDCESGLVVGPQASPPGPGQDNEGQ